MNRTELNELVAEALLTKDWESPYIEIKNCATDTRYRGINTLILPLVMEKRGHKIPLFATFNQANGKGWKVKKGAKAYRVVYWSFLDVKDRDNEDETKSIPFLKSFSVFNIDDLEGCDIPTDGKDFTVIQKENGEKVKKYIEVNEIKMTNEIGCASYSPSLDRINMPTNMVQGEYTYNATLAHEAAHSTGHESRLKRFDCSSVSAFNSKEYSIEELIAEFTAYMLGFNDPDSCLAYIKNWILRLKETDRMKEAATAWTKAQKAYELITKDA